MLPIAEQFGSLDIYLFDQLQRDRIVPGMRILDSGCGSGRNLVYFFRAGYEVFGMDVNPEAVECTRELARSLAPSLPADNFRRGRVEAMPFPELFADLVISSAVLHFARDDSEFHAMLRGTWAAVKPGGFLFCRLASSIGIESQVRSIAGRRFALPDGPEWYLVDQPLLLQLTADMDGELMDPLKTTVVQGRRAMTTWVVMKRRR